LKRRCVTGSCSGLLSIVISNYNYADYLDASIRSALAQTYPNTEVIVVDDGSTDASREVIAQYQERVRCLFKPNAGLISALNAGIEISRGQYIGFLDADDLWEPTIAEQVMNCFREDETIAKVQFRLQIIDSSGRCQGQFIPPIGQSMPSGDLTEYVPVYRTYPSPPTSGIVVPRWLLEALGFFPVQIPHLYPDHYLHHAAALAGPIYSLENTGGYYRVHGQNMFAADELSLDRLRRSIEMSVQEHEYLRRFAEHFSSVRYPETVDEFLDQAFITTCMISLKLDAEKHPLPKQSLSQLAVRGIRASISQPDVGLLRRIKQILWFTMMFVAPRQFAWRLALARSQTRTISSWNVQLPQRWTRIKRTVRRLIEPIMCRSRSRGDQT
jgi:glycosyltransferase involved in cell wall biosynthesis